MKPQNLTSILQSQISGYQQTSLIYVAAKLDLADALQLNTESAESLAIALKVPAQPLLRTLRALCVIGICRQYEDTKFGLTELGQLLRSDVPGSQKNRAILAVEQYWLSWGNLLYSVQTGKAAFDQVHGMSPWEYRQKEPELNHCFNAWLADETKRVANSIGKAISFKDSEVIVDIAGGNGALLASFLQNNLTLHGILFEQAHVLESAKKFLTQEKVASRCEFLSGDMFKSLPKQADVYLLKSVLHDWDDENAFTILKKVRASMKTDSKLLLIERILPEYGIDAAISILDMHMLVVNGGRERSLVEFQALMAESGFSMNCIMKTDSGFSILEGIPN